MAITGDNAPYLWSVYGVNNDGCSNTDDINLDAVVRLYLIVACVLGLIGLTGLAVLYLVG
jgi:hypothetical protein